MIISNINEHTIQQFDTTMYKNCTKIFHKIYYELSNILSNIVENFIIDKKHGYPSNSVYKFHLTEQMILKNKLKAIYDINSIYSFQTDSIRVFSIPASTTENKRYLISEFDEYSEVDEQYHHFYSIFIYENFFTDDNSDYVFLLFELAEKVIGYNLYKEGVPVNIIDGRSVIALNISKKGEKNEIDPNTAKFIVDYFTTIFKFIILHINIEKFGIEKIKNILSNSYSMIIYIYDINIYKIFDYAESCIYNRDTDIMYYDLCNEVYDYFLNK